MSATVHLPALLSEEFGISRSEGRRLIAQEGVFLNGAIVHEVDVAADELDGAELRIGRRRSVQLEPNR